MYDRAEPSVLVMAAGLTVDGHHGDRTCPQCTPDGCRQLAWAQPILAAYRRERAVGRAVDEALSATW